MNKDSTANKVEAVPLNIKCPVCYKNNLIMTYTVTKIPYVGDILVMGIKCTNCGFRISDIAMISHTGKNIMKSKITPKTLNDLVVLSANSTVSIPELGLEVDIRTETGGEITTIEGVLREFLEQLEQLSNSELSEEEAKIVKTLIEKIKSELKNPSGDLTLKIHDKTGKSSIVPHKAWIKRAEKERNAPKLSEGEIKNIAEEEIKKFISESNGKSN